MRAIEFTKVQQATRVEVDPPGDPAPGMAHVRTHRMGICGTDASCFLGKFPFFDFPRIPGHELGVEVIAVGDGVTNVQVGDRCSVEPYMHCDDCYACRRGAINCCKNLQVIGVMTNGGLCESFHVRAGKLHVSKQLSFDALALVETLAIGCHASNRGQAVEGDHALVIGAGPIGLATLEFVRLTGATVSVMDMNEDRLQFVKQNYGIENLVRFDRDGEHEATIAQITGGDGYQVVIDATGNRHSMSGSLAYVAPTGRLVYVGITTDEVTFRHPVLHRPEASILASRNALPEDFTRIIALIEAGTIQTDPWITHRTTFDNVCDEFADLIHPDAGAIKAMIEVT
ncbi:MAG: zinc-binding alcohol dehydrogenase family protein [Planctomycetota bacterium]